VPHYEDLERLDICLDDLERQTILRTDYEIIVADNASPVGLERLNEIVAGRAQVVVVDQRGAGPARNGGVAAARGEILAFTDCDCRPDPEWLERGLSALEAQDIVGGRVDVFPKDDARVTPVEAFEMVFAFANDAYVRDKGFSVTANLFCRKATFLAVGDFLTTVSEDAEWGRRATSMGYRLGYEDRARVRHPARHDWPELQRKWRRIDSETYQLHRHEGGSSLAWAIRCAATALSPLAHWPRVLAAQGLTPTARTGALSTLVRLRVWRSWDCSRLLMTERRGVHPPEQPAPISPQSPGL
jgi:glycosyltransferase involved in cell wall biosynthesis